MKKLAALLVCGLALGACRSDHDRYEDEDQWITARQTDEVDRESKETWDTTQRRTREASAPYPPTAAMFSGEDREFVTKAAQGGMFEVESSRLALRKNVSDPYREFAQKMVEDHGKSNDELAEIVRRKGGTLPGGMTRDDERELEELRKLDGPEFEQRYMQAQIKAHDQAISTFQNASQELHDNDLKTFANQTLGTLRQHREHLEKMEY
jgi:putative membrane protein